LVFGTQPHQFVIGSINGFTSSDVTVTSDAIPKPAFTLTFRKNVFKSGASISFTVGQDEAGHFAGFTQSQDGVGVDALDLADGATFTAQLAGHSRETITGRFSAGGVTHAYKPGDGFGLIDAITAVSAVKRGK
jgi:hypothetical protein